MPAIPELTEPLSDDRVALRFYAERDIPEILIAHQDDRGMHKRLGAIRPPSGAELGRRSEQAPGELAAGTHVTLTVVRAGDDECRGQIDVHAIDWDHGRAELGIWIAPQVRSVGLARRALALAAGWLLTACGLERVALITEPDNQAMIRAARAAGFVEEGVLRGYTRERGERVDGLVLSMIRSDLAFLMRGSA